MLNQTVIVGRIVREPELKETENAVSFFVKFNYMLYQ